MEIEEKETKHHRIKFNLYQYCYLTHSMSNCKLTNIDYIYNIPLNIETYVKVFEQCRSLISVNTIKKDIVDFIQKNFEVYDISTAPVGYNEALIQYHILIRNTFINSSYSRKKEPTILNNTTTEIKEKLITAFKKKRRKTDIIEEIFK